MKKSKKYFAFFLVVAVSLNIMCTRYVDAAIHTNELYTLYEQETRKIINIDGVNYTYNYCYENGNRTIIITNDENDTINKLYYDESTSVIYLDDNLFAIPVNDIQQRNMSLSTYGWQTISSSSHRITWAQGTTVAIVAGAIAVYLGTLGAAGVIAAMGSAALGVLAASSVGGTLYVSLQEYYVPLTMPQYRYKWSFTASTGDSYGPYYYHYYA